MCLSNGVWGSRGLKYCGISLKDLQKPDNKVKKDSKTGFNTKDGVEKAVDAANYNREAKALL